MHRPFKHLGKFNICQPKRYFSKRDEYVAVLMVLIAAAVDHLTLAKSSLR